MSDRDVDKHKENWKHSGGKMWGCLPFPARFEQEQLVLLVFGGFFFFLVNDFYFFHYRWFTVFC